jgi:hypothetical protein
MIKGAQKQMIVVRTGSSTYFDEAYFVLRKEVKAPRKSRDILLEANRILEESRLPVRRPVKKSSCGWWGFLAGALSGGGVVAVVFVFLL